jgi:hypothetical protein
LCASCSELNSPEIRGRPEAAVEKVSLATGYEAAEKAQKRAPRIRDELAAAVLATALSLGATSDESTEIKPDDQQTTDVRLAQSILADLLGSQESG